MRDCEACNGIDPNCATCEAAREAGKAIRLTQTATWNKALTNPYRTRYATAGGRYFEVVAKNLDNIWFINEITADGTWIPTGYGHIVFRLSDARTAIAKEAGQ